MRILGSALALYSFLLFVRRESFVMKECLSRFVSVYNFLRRIVGIDVEFGNFIKPLALGWME
jgi:hypothetical protein